MSVQDEEFGQTGGIENGTEEARLYREWKRAARQLQRAHLAMRRATLEEAQARAELGTLAVRDLIPADPPPIEVIPVPDGPAPTVSVPSEG